MNWQRLFLGLIGLTFLALGAFLYFFGPDTAEFYVGICVKVGMLLCVIWLAMPQLEPIKSRIPGYVLLLLLILLISVAVRPRLFPVLSGILAIALTLSWALKWVSRLSSDPRRKRTDE